MFELGKIVEQIRDLDKTPTKVVMLFLLSSGTLLGVPDPWLKSLRLGRLAADYGQWVGVIFLLATVFLLLNLIGFLLGKWASRRIDRRQRAMIIHAATNLDDAEKAVLREFFILRQNTIRLPLDEPIVAGLVKKGILKQVGTLGEKVPAGLVFPCALSDVAREFLTSQRVGMPKKPSAADERQILQLRPHFAAEIQRREARRAG